MLGGIPALKAVIGSTEQMLALPLSDVLRATFPQAMDLCTPFHPCTHTYHAYPPTCPPIHLPSHPHECSHALAHMLVRMCAHACALSCARPCRLVPWGPELCTFNASSPRRRLAGTGNTRLCHASWQGFASNRVPRPPRRLRGWRSYDRCWCKLWCVCQTIFIIQVHSMHDSMRLGEIWASVVRSVVKTGKPLS